jgi:hypothetical protein
MSAGLKGRAHFVEADFESALGGLPGGFAASQSAADNGEVGHGCDSTKGRG